MKHKYSAQRCVPVYEGRSLVAALLMVAVLGGSFSCEFGDGTYSESSGDNTSPPSAANNALDDVPDCNVFQIAFQSDCIADGVFPHEDKTLTSYRASATFLPGPEPLLHVVAISTAAEEDLPPGTPEPVGEAAVSVTTTKRPLVLALVAANPTDWIVDVAPNVQIDSVVLYGDSQSVAGLSEDIPIMVMQGNDAISNVAYCWPYGMGCGATPSLVADLEDVTGLPVEAFDGCYITDQMTIGHECAMECEQPLVCQGYECGINEDCAADCGACGDGLSCLDHVCQACTPSCDGKQCGPDGCGGWCGECGAGACASDGNCVAPGVAATESCWSLTSETHYCLLLRHHGAVLVGLDTGTTCPVGPQNGLLTSYAEQITSLGWKDEHVYTCLGDWIVRVSLLDASWEVAPFEQCYSVTTWNGGLLVGSIPHWEKLTSDNIGGQFERKLMYFESFEAVKAGKGTAVLVPTLDTRQTVLADVLYTAHHSTEKVNTISLPDGELLEPIELEDFDGRVVGMSVTEDGLLFINTPSNKVGKILVFDRATGERISEIALTPAVGEFPNFSALVCYPGGFYP